MRTASREQGKVKWRQKVVPGKQQSVYARLLVSEDLYQQHCQFSTIISKAWISLFLQEKKPQKYKYPGLSSHLQGLSIHIDSRSSTEVKNPLRLPNTVKNTLMSCNCFQMQVAFNTKMPTIRSLLLLPIQRMHLVWFKKKKIQKAVFLISQH